MINRTLPAMFVPVSGAHNAFGAHSQLRARNAAPYPVQYLLVSLPPEGEGRCHRIALAFGDAGAERDVLYLEIYWDTEEEPEEFENPPAGLLFHESVHLGSTVRHDGFLALPLDPVLLVGEGRRLSCRYWPIGGNGYEVAGVQVTTGVLRHELRGL